MLTFFGLNKQYRASLFRQIHEIVFHGNGGYDWSTIYNMPIWLRNLTFTLIENNYKEQSNSQSSEDTWLSGEAREAAKQNNQIQVPSYVTKASKK